MSKQTFEVIYSKSITIDPELTILYWDEMSEEDQKEVIEDYAWDRLVTDGPDDVDVT